MNFTVRTLNDYQLRISARPDALMIVFGLPFLLVGGYMLINLPFALIGIVTSPTLTDLAARLGGLAILIIMIGSFGLPGLLLTTGKRTIKIDAARGELVEHNRRWLRRCKDRHSTQDARLVMLKWDRIAPSSTRNAGERDYSCYHLELVWENGKTVTLALHDDAERLRPWGQMVADMLQLEFRDKELLESVEDDTLSAHGRQAVQQLT